MNLWLYLLLVNAVTFALYGFDKKSARRGVARVPEYLLLLGGFAGGTLAAILGQRFFRHKTKKLRFQFQFWGLTALQLALLALQPPELMQLLAALQR